MGIKRYLMSNGDVRLSEHFMLHEFQSKNGCNEVLVDEALINILEQIYKHFNCSKAIINDGYREPGRYCQSIGGSVKDAHAHGMAADVVFYDSEADVIPGRYICCYAQDIGVQGIGYMGNAVHLDTRGNGGYYNRHWWGDETTGADVNDWHSYFSITNYAYEESAASSDENRNYIKFEGGGIMSNNMTREQLKYEVNRHALTLLGREIGDADTYVDYLTDGTLDWYEFDRRLQESEEGVKRWIKLTLFIDILGRIPAQSEIDWWYAQYCIYYEMNKSLMVRRFAEDYEKFKEEYLNK